MNFNIVQTRSEQAAIIHRKYLAANPPAAPKRPINTSSPVSLDNDSYLKRGLDKDPLLRDLWNNKRSYSDESANDQALMNKIMYYTNGDIERAMQAFRVSPYAAQKDKQHRDKLERPDYLKRTAETALKCLSSTAAADDEQFHRTRERKKNSGNTTAEAAYINPIASPEAVERYTLDDIGNSRLFADSFKGKILFLPDYKAWWFYKNGVWQIDNGDVVVRQFAKSLADYVRDIIPPLPAAPEKGDKWAAHRKHWSKCRFITPIKAQIQLAQDELSGSATDFDQQPYLFNCKNGTLNLQTGKLQPHDPADLLSKQANVIYDPAAKCERFERFISEITEGDIDRAKMLQKALGYTLKGEANEECYFTAIGEKTRNGKGTLFDTVLHLFGSYGKQIDFDTIAKSGAKDGSRATPDLARLIGIRFVLSNEPDKGVFVNEALLKQITGNDDITARPLYGAPIQFKPVFRLFITANSKPNVSDDSLFTSDRIKILPFTRHFTEDERDSTLKAKLRKPEALSGILNWLLAGYKLYQSEGLKNTAEMKTLVAEYRRENDYVGLYLEERIILTLDEPKTHLTVRELRSDYNDWCLGAGIKPLGLKSFKAELSKRDISTFINYNHQEAVRARFRTGCPD